MSRALAVAAPRVSERADTLTESPRGPTWMRLTSVATLDEAAAAAPIWEATGASLRAASLPSVAAERERMILDVLLAPIAPLDGHRVGNDRKEARLRELFAALPVLEAMELHRRLRIARADDAVAVAFGRLVFERRQRLLTFLGEARRRTALARG